jgi:gliding motility-associated-like protein
VVDNWAPVLAGTVINGDTVFLDNVEEYGMNRTGASGKFCYYVEAVEGNSNPYGIIGTSISDLNCSVQFDRVFIPNSFTPNGDALNAEFLPIVTFVRENKYELTVYDRWGTKVFETNDRLKGWNGKINGNRCATGTYVYSLKYMNSRDELKEIAGFVYLFYP